MSDLASLSVVIPCYNEEEVIENTYERLSALLRDWCATLISGYEIVMVNNGSTDNTLGKMLGIRERDDNVTVVDLRRNYGYQGSITAGLFHAKEDMVVSIDADLQDDPSKIKDMILKFYEGYEMVLGVRKNRDSDSRLKRYSAQLYYRLLNKLGVRSVYNHGDFRLLSRQLVDDFKRMSERNRYIRGMIFELESRYACVFYDRTERKAGKTKFDLPNLFGLAIDGITSFTSIPIRFVSFIGLSMFFISIIGFFYVLFMKYVINVRVPGWSSIAVIVLFYGGIQTLSLGIIGEYISKIYFETKQRPLFLVRHLYTNSEADLSHVPVTNACGVSDKSLAKD